jgi:hypothetical protein
MISEASLKLLMTTVNATGCLDATATFDDIDSAATAAAAIMLPGERRARAYADGSSIINQPFAVLYKVPSRDSATRIDAAHALYALADALEDVSPVSGLGTIKGVDTPYCTTRDDAGTETWYASFMLESELQER